LPNLLSSDTCEVVATGATRPAAIDPESKWTEAALGVARLHEAKDMASIVAALRVQELPPRGVGAPLRSGGIFRALSTRRIVEAPTLWPSLRSSPWIRWYPQPWFSVASRSISAAISGLTGGRRARAALPVNLVYLAVAARQLAVDCFVTCRLVPARPESGKLSVLGGLI
jgi:hypothetical protein